MLTSTEKFLGGSGGQSDRGLELLSLIENSERGGHLLARPSWSGVGVTGRKRGSILDPEASLLCPVSPHVPRKPKLAASFLTGMP